ncbi:DNA packaging protein/ATPase [Equine parapoxvirus]|nr:DNA packaging protein/ATPase [Equine parapoxvirus]WOC35532.1 DNA packaging protein/ATPase [Equine parapoxvirus]WOC35539.1 DNA packaging protein/ATPase [Equine parapoxvirus]
MDVVQEARFRRESLTEAPFRMALVGGSGSGKTAYLLSLFRTLVRRFKHILLFTPVYNSAYDGYVWPDHIQKVTTHEELEYNLSVTKRKIEKYAQTRKHRFLIILDDMGDTQTRSPTLLGLMNYGRHINVSLVLLCQTYKHIPVNGRASITHLCCCNVSDSDVENVLRSMSIRGSKKRLIRAMAIMRSAGSRRVLIIEDSVFCQNQERICYDFADDAVVRQSLDPGILLAQFSHMKDRLSDIVGAEESRREDARARSA